MAGMLFCLEGVNFNEQMNKYLWISRNYSRILGSVAAVIKTCNIFSKWCKLFYTGDPKRCVPIFCSIKKTFFNECLFCCRT